MAIFITKEMQEKMERKGGYREILWISTFLKDVHNQFITLQNQDKKYKMFLKLLVDEKFWQVLDHI